jgi:hypothetical protein
MSLSFSNGIFQIRVSCLGAYCKAMESLYSACCFEDKFGVYSVNLFAIEEEDVTR